GGERAGVPANAGGRRRAGRCPGATTPASAAPVAAVAAAGPGRGHAVPAGAAAGRRPGRGSAGGPTPPPRGGGGARGARGGRGRGGGRGARPGRGGWGGRGGGGPRRWLGGDVEVALGRPDVLMVGSERAGTVPQQPGEVAPCLVPVAQLVGERGQV